jgi:hypothetical protein
LLAGLAIVVRELGKLLETPERAAVVVKRGWGRGARDAV